MKCSPKIETPEQYLESLPPDRRAALAVIHDAIRSAAPDLDPHIEYGMIGYGRYGNGPAVALASQKNYISLYVGQGDCEGGYLADTNKDRLGKVSVGRSCIRFRKLEDLELDVAMGLVRQVGLLLAR